MICSTDPVEIEVPHEPGNFFSFVRSPWPVLRRARKVQSDAVMETTAKMSPEALEYFAKKHDPDDSPDPEATKFKPDQYDTETLLVGVKEGNGYEGGALVGWRGPDYAGIKCNPENIRRLDEPTADWAKAEALALTIPNEADRKNDSPD